MAHNNINNLKEEAGVSLLEAKKALDLCGDYEAAKKYLRLRFSSVARYKTVAGKKVPFETDDYVSLAKNFQ